MPLLHVPYRGAAPAMVDLVAGRVDMMFIGVLPSKQHLDAGTLRVLGVTSKTRMPEVPNAPTMAEAGIRTSIPSSCGSASPRRQRRRSR